MADRNVPDDFGDIDIVIKPTPENAERIVKAVAAFGAAGLGYGASDYLSGDFIQIGGVAVRFPSKECLLLNKQAAGRAKDLRHRSA